MKFRIWAALAALLVSCGSRQPVSREDEIDPPILDPGNLAIRKPLREPVRNWKYVEATAGLPRTLIIAGDKTLTAWDAGSGERAWKSGVETGESVKAIGKDGDAVVFRSNDGRLIWVSVGSGDQLKDLPIDGKPELQHLGTVLGTDKDGKEVFAWKGLPRWNRPIEFDAKTVTVAGLGSYVIASGPVQGEPPTTFFQIIDLGTGKTLWKESFPGSRVEALLGDRFLAITTADQLTVRDAETGREVWSKRQPLRGVVVQDDQVRLWTKSNYVVTFELATGVEVSRVLRRQPFEFMTAIRSEGIRYEVQTNSSRQCWMEASGVSSRTKLWKTEEVGCAQATRPIASKNLILVDLGDGMRVYPAGS